MNPDAYMFFTKCHWLYVNGVRRALRERLETAFSEDWWEKGVEHALPPEQLTSLHNEIEREPNRDRDLILDATHFGYIITKHHNELFQGVFKDSVRAFMGFRRLTALRNEWAHIQDIPLVRARQAAGLMTSILASLNCEEALEVERMSQEFAPEPGTGTSEDFNEDLDHQDERFDHQEPPATPWEFWRQLQSYLILEKSVDPPEDQSNDRTRVIVKIHNTAPDSKDLPTVQFRDVRIRASGGQNQELERVRPGESREVAFTFPAKGMMAVEFEVTGKIDSDELFSFTRTTSLPEEVIAPLKREFTSRLEAVAIKELIKDVLDAIGTPDPNVTLADIKRVRDSLNEQSELIKGKRTELAQLFRDFNLERDSTLGARLREIILALEEFEKKLTALDEAIGHTDLELMNEAVSDLKQIQLAVLRVEDTVRTLTANT